ncbi:Prenylcysteine lyase-domain-containing protein [Lipomyces japonicus]|uniref:Prenylcysteine lyase-domain-containing protein n=1 Tax=Lipomyces japonicus TaxID=56871 RepID=UPI0034CE5F16
MIYFKGVLINFLVLIIHAAANQEVFEPQSDKTSPFFEKNRIAIIGAGAGGTSAAYYLQKYSKSGYDITIFEKNSYIGGRSTTINVHNDSRWPIELGASIFVQENLNLVNAAKEFELNITQTSIGRVKKADGVQVPDSIGIWDGKDFVFQVASESSWKKIGKLIYQYGLAPIKARRLAKKIIATFIDYYSPAHFPFNDLTGIAKITGLANITKYTAYNFLTDTGVGELFVDHLVQAATRANYAQNIRQIQALEAVVCLAADEGLNIEGGNWRIFDSFAKKSGANIKLDTEVDQINRNGDKWEVFFNNAVEEFDQVIIAAPYYQTGIKGLSVEVEEVPYVLLYVTLLTSTKRLSPKYFGTKNGGPVPTYLLTTLPKDFTSHPPPLFNSISIVRYIPQTKEYVYKIFSLTRIKPQFLQLIFEDGAEFNWSYEKIWKPYPVLKPTNQFEKFKLDNGLWYLNGIETFISTMETSSLAGANVAALIVGPNNKTIVEVP